MVEDVDAVATLWLSAVAAARVRSHAEKGYPEEVCGALGGTHDGTGWRVTRCEAAVNAWAALGLEPDDAAGPERRFAIDPAWILRVEQSFRADNIELVGFYHSHPDHPAEPSETDRRLLWPRVVQLICSVRGGRSEDLRAWYQAEDHGPLREMVVERGE